MSTKKFLFPTIVETARGRDRARRTFGHSHATHMKLGLRPKNGNGQNPALHPLRTAGFHLKSPRKKHWFELARELCRGMAYGESQASRPKTDNSPLHRRVGNSEGTKSCFFIRARIEKHGQQRHSHRLRLEDDCDLALYRGDSVERILNGHSMVSLPHTASNLCIDCRILNSAPLAAYRYKREYMCTYMLQRKHLPMLLWSFALSMYIELARTEPIVCGSSVWTGRVCLCLKMD